MTRQPYHEPTHDNMAPVVTRQETLRFVLALADHPWASNVLPPSWKRVSNGRAGKGTEWRDLATRTRIPVEDVRERIVRQVEDAWGFTPTRAETLHLESILSVVHAEDPIHQFVARYLIRADEGRVPLDDAWQMWKRFRPEGLEMPQARWIEALAERGYRVELDAAGDGFLLGWWKRVKAVRPASGRIRQPLE